MVIEIINFRKTYEKDSLKLFYQYVFHNRKEFEYARLPSWSHRYNLEDESIARLAFKHKKIVGSLGLISYEGYYKGEKQKIGFFIDNCVHPDFISDYDEIMKGLFKSVEEQAKKQNIYLIMGWDYTHKAELHDLFFQNMGYYRIDGINWFGCGTKHVHAFFEKGRNLSVFWRIVLNLMNLKFRSRERKLIFLSDGKIRALKNSDISSIVKLINEQNRNLLFSPKYTENSLIKIMEKYHTKGLVAEIDGKIVGVLIFFVAPWSGWMYGKPEYTSSSTFFLINHPLEFAVIPEYAKDVAPHLLFAAMTKGKEKYLMFVDVFDRRTSWMRQVYLDIGADELPYDYGTIFCKSLTREKIQFDLPLYVPTNLVISPYTTKDY